MPNLHINMQLYTNIKCYETQDSAKAAQQGILLPQHAAYRTFTPTVLGIAAGASKATRKAHHKLYVSFAAISPGFTCWCLAMPCAATYAASVTVILALLCAFVEYEDPHLAAGQMSQYYK
jgi:hypothetical protein